jgi:murein DD-endopeptidase MepM/ murein hydrolase activator NlpD
LHKLSKKLVFVSLKSAQFLKRYWHGYSAPLKDKVWIVVTSAWTLRIAVLVGIVSLLVPQTNLFADVRKPLPQESLLYRLVGPGEEYFVEEAITEDGFFQGDTQAWSAGAVRQEVVDQDTTGTIEPTDITSLAVGGTALTKPNIIPGAELGEGRTETINYVVQSGDVVGTIAQGFGISVSTILWENDLSFRSYIRPGDTLRILPVTGLRYEIKKGDTLTKIVKKYDVDSVAEVIDYNKLADASDLTVGQALILPGGSEPRAVYVPRTTGRLTSIAAPVPSIDVPAGTLYAWPTTVTKITQYYGWRHTGLDIAGPVGTPLIASRAGTVTRSKCGWSGGFGCHVILDHGDGVQTVYAHASRIYVDVGEAVDQGQTIAAMGSTGRSTGSHIHFEVRDNGWRQNPLKYVR